MYTMNRCLPLYRRLGLAVLLVLVVCSSLLSLQPAVAQTSLQAQRIPPIAAKAQAGVLRVTAPPEALLNGQPVRLAPGARIRDRNNLMVVSGALIGQDLPVRYTRDPLGLVHEVWVLTAAEAAALTPPPPALPAY